MNAHALVFTLLCALFPTGLAAQDSLVRATIDSGSLIRMHPHSGAPIRGRLIQPITPVTTEIHTCRYPAPPCTPASDTSAYQRIPTSSLTGIEVQQGSRWTTGALIGGAIGAALGGLAGGFVNGMCEDPTGCGPATGVYVLIAAAGFAGFGALIGSGSPLAPSTLILRPTTCAQHAEQTRVVDCVVGALVRESFVPTAIQPAGPSRPFCLKD